jgi:hypothetical protein
MLNRVIRSSVRNLEPMNPRTLAPFGVVFLSILIFIPNIARAQGLLQGISGIIDLNYSFFSSKTTDATGNVTKTKTNDFNPRFSLFIDTSIFPNLRLNAGGIFEKDFLVFKTDGTETKTKTTILRPYANLTLNTPLYTAGIGYDRREETHNTSGAPSVTNINENYNAILGWRPEGLPSFELRYIRTNTFDEKRLTQDVTKDFFSLYSRYTYQGLDITYLGSYVDTKDKLINLETKDLTQSGKITYSNFFFDKRVSFTGSYNISHDEIKTITAGVGTVGFQIFPFAGLFVISDTPNSVTLPSNSALIDGNLTASAGINIGLPPPLGDTHPRNIGLNFLNATEVNNLLVWIDRDLSTSPAIANSFSWQIWTSSDNLNWSLFTTISPAPFGPFQNRFELNFPNVTTRYIKVVVSPLSPVVPGAASFPDIFVTELQAFLNKPAESVKGKTTRISHILNVDSKTRILDTPFLFYDLSYFYTRTDPSGLHNYTLSNAFSASHRFSSIFSGTARVAREDGVEQKEKRTAYIYNASLDAVPLRTLRNTLVFSGRMERIGGKPNDNNSIFLINTAALYQGVDVNLSTGVNFIKNETGEKQDNINIDLGANIVPHRSLTVTLHVSDTETDRSGGGKPDSSTYTRKVDVSAAYNPFRSLYIFTLIEAIAEKGQKTQITQNYGLNWSPFPDGALQFRFNYNETLRSEDNGKDRIINPGVRWNITRRSYLDVSYQLISSKSNTQKTDLKLFSTNLKIFF